MIIKNIEVAFGSNAFDHDALSAAISQTVADRIRDKSGFNNRYICADNETIFDVGRKLFSERSVQNDLLLCDAVIVVSEYTRGLVPPPSAFILSDYDLPNSLVIDMNRGCSGWCEALVLADNLLRGGAFNEIAIITAENYSSMIDRNNRNLAPIFSDCVACTFISKGGSHIEGHNHGSFHSVKEDLIYRSDEDQLYMSGPGLVSFVKTKVVPDLKSLLSYNQGIRKVDHFFAHQGSKLVISTLNDSLEDYAVPPCEFTAGDFGNTNASSIPLSIREVLQRKRGDQYDCLLSGFGVGLSYCNVAVTLEF